LCKWIIKYFIYLKTRIHFIKTNHIGCYLYGTKLCIFTWGQLLQINENLVEMIFQIVAYYMWSILLSWYQSWLTLEEWLVAEFLSPSTLTVQVPLSQGSLRENLKFFCKIFRPKNNTIKGNLCLIFFNTHHKAWHS
jgi:hypothetical protein